MSKVPKYIAIKYMCEILYKRSKVQISMYSMISMSEMVFAAFMQHCMQSTDYMSEMLKILCIQWPLVPPGGKARCSHTIRPVGLAVHHHAV